MTAKIPENPRKSLKSPDIEVFKTFLPALGWFGLGKGGIGTALIPPGLALPLGLCLGATEVLVPLATTDALEAEAEAEAEAAATDADADGAFAPDNEPLLTGNCCWGFMAKVDGWETLSILVLFSWDIGTSIDMSSNDGFLAFCKRMGEID